MKKLLLLLLITFIACGMVFAEDGDDSSSPEVTYGFSGSFGYNVLKENTTDTFAGDGSAGSETAKANPKAMTANDFTVTPNVTMDWTKFILSLDGRYDQFNATDSDYSYFKVGGTYKSLLGVSGLDVTYSTEYHNSGDIDGDGTSDGTDDTDADGDVDGDDDPLSPAGNVALNQTAQTLKLNYAGDEVNFYATWDADTMFNNLNLVTVGNLIQDIGNAFNEAAITLDNDQVAAGVTYSAATGSDFSGGTATLSNAYITGKNMFGVWEAKIGDIGATKYLRMQKLDNYASVSGTDFTSGGGLGSFAANAFTASAAGDFTNPDGNAWTSDSFTVSGIDVLNTITPMEALNVYIGTIYPVNYYDGVSVQAWPGTAMDYLAGGFMDIGAKYALSGVGSIGAGMEVTKDYEIVEASQIKGDSQLRSKAGSVLAAYASATTPSANELIDNAPGFWIDANLSDLMGPLSLQASLDFDMNEYVDYFNINDNYATAAVDDQINVSGVAANIINFGFEAGFDVNDSLSVLASTVVEMGTGYDYKKWTGIDSNWSDDETDVAGEYDAASWTEANWANANVYGVTPFDIKVRADYTLNDAVAVYGSNEFIKQAGALADNSTVANTNTANGYYDKDVITLGTNLTASESSKVNIEAGYNLYMGIPSASDLYADGISDDQQAGVDAEYGEFVSSNYNPYTVSVSYSFSY